MSQGQDGFRACLQCLRGQIASPTTNSRTPRTSSCVTSQPVICPTPVWSRRPQVRAGLPGPNPSSNTCVLTAVCPQQNRIKGYWNEFS